MGISGVKIITVGIEGIADLLMHNGQLADPLNEATKKLKAATGVKKKTDKDHENISRLEFLGGLYWDDVIGIYIPGEMLLGCIINGAKRNKLGKSFKSAVFINSDFPLKYGETKPKTIEDVWTSQHVARDVRGVRVGMQRICRTRPRFRAGWSVNFEITMMEGAEVNVNDIKTAIVNGGLFAGLGDYRPQYGRFELKTFDVA